MRKTQEDLRAQALARVRNERRLNERQQAELVQEQRRVLEGTVAATEGRFDACDVRRYYQYERHLARLADEKDAAIRQLREQEEERRTELEAAMKERRLLEELRERQTRAFNAELDREFQRFADEVATNHAATTRRGEREE